MPPSSSCASTSDTASASPGTLRARSVHVHPTACPVLSPLPNPTLPLPLRLVLCALGRECLLRQLQRTCHLSQPSLSTWRSEPSRSAATQAAHAIERLFPARFPASAFPRQSLSSAHAPQISWTCLCAMSSASSLKTSSWAHLLLSRGPPGAASSSRSNAATSSRLRKRGVHFRHFHALGLRAAALEKKSALHMLLRSPLSLIIMEP